MNTDHCQNAQLYIDDFSAPQYKAVMQSNSPYKFKLVIIALLWYTILVLIISYVYSIGLVFTFPLPNIYNDKIVFNILILNTIFTIFMFMQFSKYFWNPIKYYYLRKKYNKYEKYKDCVFQMKD